MAEFKIRKHGDRLYLRGLSKEGKKEVRKLIKESEAKHLVIFHGMHLEENTTSSLMLLRSAELIFNKEDFKIITISGEELLGLIDSMMQGEI